MVQNNTPTTWSYERLLALSPSPDAMVQARKLFFAKRWLTLAGNGQWLWGEYESPFGEVVQAYVRLEPPLMRCNCKARQRPCKHTLAIMLLFLNRPEAWQVVDTPPDWVKTGATDENIPARYSSPKIAASNDDQQKRLALMDEGVAELEEWLRHLAQQGLAESMANTATWEQLAARLVDSKLGSIARRVRRCIALADQSDNLPALMDELGALLLFAKAWQRKSTLQPTQKQTLLQLAGWATKKEQLLARPGVADQWLVTGMETGVEEQIHFRKTWLLGQRTARFAMVLEFVYGQSSFEGQWLVGAVLDGELVYYPEEWPQRAIFRHYQGSRLPYDIPAPTNKLEAMAQDFAQALAKSPWITDFPVLLSEMTPVRDPEKGTFALVDATLQCIALATTPACWVLLSVSAGQPITLFGTWDGYLFNPLSVIDGDRLSSLTE